MAAASVWYDGLLANAERLDRERQDFEVDLWISLNESNLEIWYEGWLEGVSSEMYADQGMIAAQVVSAWNRHTCVHEPGFLVATEIDTGFPKYRVLVLAPERPGANRPFNDFQRSWYELDNDPVVSEAAGSECALELNAVCQDRWEPDPRSDNSSSTSDSCHALSPMSAASSESSDESFRHRIRPGVFGVNAEDAFVPVVGEEGVERRTWKALMASRRRQVPADGPIPIGGGHDVWVLP